LTKQSAATIIFALEPPSISGHPISTNSGQPSAHDDQLMTQINASNNEPMVSIVVPVFNVAAYLEESLKSLASQDFDYAYEVILIDDCSADSSLDICRQFVEKNQLSNFRILKNEQNQGVSVTRNRGLDEASGRYFMFVDPDDLLSPNALSAMFEAAEKYEATIVKGNNTIFDDSGESEARYDVSNTSLVSKDQILTTFYEHKKVRGHPWGKLFRRKLLGEYRFPAGVRMAQDLLYCSEVFSHADSLVLLARNVYRYRNRDSGSTGRKFESGSYLDWLDAVDRTGQFASSADHLRAHKNLLVRTMTQLARECRKLPVKTAKDVLEVIEQRCEKWNIRILQLILKDRLGARSIARYLKMRMAIRETRRQISGSH
jgi:glycosyltransferase involved in cell wall biosynthesis